MITLTSYHLFFILQLQNNIALSEKTSCLGVSIEQVSCWTLIKFYDKTKINHNEWSLLVEVQLEPQSNKYIY